MQFCKIGEASFYSDYFFVGMFLIYIIIKSV